jgi:uncharacterized membrane protein
MAEDVVLEIDAPVARVWRVWTDVSAWPGWNSAVRQVTRLDDGEMGVGARARVRQPQLPATIWEVTEWQPEERWVWVTRQPGTTTTSVHLVEDLGDGRSRVTSSAEQSGALGGVARRAFGGLTRTLLERETADLRRRCEGGRGVAPKHAPEGFRH